MRRNNPTGMLAYPLLPLAADRRNDLIDHFLALPKEDMRLRFGHTLSLPSIENYVDDMDFKDDGIFGVFDSDLRLVGVAHVALLRKVAEFGVSVAPGCRGRGLGRALFRRAITFARNHHVDSLFVHCLAENQPMLHIACSAGMRVVHHTEEVDAWLSLGPRDISTLTEAYLQNRVALFDFALKSQALATRKIAGALFRLDSAAG